MNEHSRPASDVHSMKPLSTGHPTSYPLISGVIINLNKPGEKVAPGKCEEQSHEHTKEPSLLLRSTWVIIKGLSHPHQPMGSTEIPKVS